MKDSVYDQLACCFGSVMAQYLKMGARVREDCSLNGQESKDRKTRVVGPTVPFRTYPP